MTVLCSCPNCGYRHMNQAVEEKVRSILEQQETKEEENGTEAIG